MLGLTISGFGFQRFGGLEGLGFRVFGFTA